MVRLLSVVLPAFNEEEVIKTTYQRLYNVLESMITDKQIKNYEILFVNDGSADTTWEIINNLHEKNPHVIGVNLSKNFGLQSAYTAGLSVADGEYIAMLDCDLQDPPELLKAMLEKAVANNSDVVYGRRFRRKEGIFRRMAMRVFHKVFSRVSTINAPADVGNFSLMSRRALESLLSFKEKTRYLPGLRFFVGFKQDYVEYERDDRAAGDVKMSFKRLMKLAMDAIFSFSDVPLRFLFIMGVVGVVVFFGLGIYVLVSKLILGEAVPGWSSTLLSIYFLGSVQLLFLGVLGQYIFRIYKEVQNRPIFIISEVLKEEKKVNK